MRDFVPAAPLTKMHDRMFQLQPSDTIGKAAMGTIERSPPIGGLNVSEKVRPGVETGFNGGTKHKWMLCS